MNRTLAPSTYSARTPSGTARSLLAQLRRYLGFAVVLGGALALLHSAVVAFPMDNPGMRGALIGGSIAALATALGTLPVLLSQQFSQRTYDTLLGFGAGVMLAASSFSLIIPALAAAKSQGEQLGGGRHRGGRHFAGWRAAAGD